MLKIFLLRILYSQSIIHKHPCFHLHARHTKHGDIAPTTPRFSYFCACVDFRRARSSGVRSLHLTHVAQRHSSQRHLTHRNWPLSPVAALAGGPSITVQLVQVALSHIVDDAVKISPQPSQMHRSQTHSSQTQPALGSPAHLDPTQFRHVTSCSPTERKKG